MATPDSIRGAAAVNPTAFELDILQFAEAGLTVVPRGEIGGTEIRISDRFGDPVSVLLAAKQAMAVAALLIMAAAAVDDAEHRL
jgi:hypothetical protein